MRTTPFVTELKIRNTQTCFDRGSRENADEGQTPRTLDEPEHACADVEGTAVPRPQLRPLRPHHELAGCCGGCCQDLSAR